MKDSKGFTNFGFHLNKGFFFFVSRKFYKRVYKHWAVSLNNTKGGFPMILLVFLFVPFREFIFFFL